MAEVVNEPVPPNARPIQETPRYNVTAPLIRFNAGTTFQSPCFWLIVGALGSLAIVYMLHSSKK